MAGGEEGEEGEEEKRLVDLRRSSLMALPQVKMCIPVLADHPSYISQP